MQAIKGLWRWWYWRADPAVRNRIEDPLIAGLAEPRHPWVRRNLVEALYIIGDDNIRYLYQNWVPSLATAESRRRATDGQHETVNRLGAKYVAVLETRQPSPARGRPERDGGILRTPRTGGPDRQRPRADAFLRRHGLARSPRRLIKQLADPDPTIRRLALEALVTVRGDQSGGAGPGGPRRLGDPDALGSHRGRPR